jgi:hypothetical protein
MQDLGKLFLGNCRIREMPLGISKLRQLKTLDLSDNEIETLPIEFTRMESLKILNLSQNNFTSFSDAFCQFRNLEHLELNGNGIETIPPGIENLQSLKILKLATNGFESVPAELGKLTKLENLDLKNNNLKIVPAELGRLKNLNSLSLNNNSLESIPSELSNLKNPWLLDLSNNKLKSLPASFRKLGIGFRVLRLANNPLDEIGTNGNMGRTEIIRHFGSRVQFASNENISLLKPVSKKRALENMRKMPLHWSLERLKQLVNITLSTSSFTEEQMLNAWESIHSTLISKERSALITNYIGKLYNPELECQGFVPMKTEFIPMAKDYLEAIFKKYSKLREKAKTEEIDAEGIILSSVQDICASFEYCPDRQISEFRLAYDILRGQLKDEVITLDEYFKRFVAASKEAIFDAVFTKSSASRNVHILTYWKHRLSQVLGFDFKFDSRMGTIEQDPFFGKEGTALQAFFDTFTPEQLISNTTEEINRKGDFRSAAAKYIYESEESESIKRTWCEMDDEEFLNITKVTRAFVEDYLLKMGILERAGDEAQNPII